MLTWTSEAPVPTGLRVFVHGLSATSYRLRFIDANSASDLAANICSHRDLILRGTRQPALPPSLRDDRLDVAGQRVRDLRVETPIALPIHLEPAPEPVLHHRLSLLATAEEMFDRIRAGLLARLKARAGVVAGRLLESDRTRHEDIIVGERKAGTAAIGDRSELALIDEAAAPHLSRCLRR